MTEIELNEYRTIKHDATIRTATKTMDLGGIGFIVVIDNDEKVIGVISDGDFRRAILAGISLDNNVLEITNKNFVYLSEDYSEEDTARHFNEKGIEYLPVLSNKKLTKIITSHEFLSKNKRKYKDKCLDTPVVIMAGGKGTRLDPFTRILPKSLIPIGDTPILEIIMKEYQEFGINEFYISVNHKDKMVKAYFEENKPFYNIQYLIEDKPLGTAGALRMLTNKVNTTFFLSNCDIIIRENYKNFFDFHKKGGFTISLIGSIQYHAIPYGVCEINNKGELLKIKEKPEYSFIANTGMYLIEPVVYNYIPQDTCFHLTDLVAALQNDGHKIGVYPVSEKAWIDVGQWEEYKKALKTLQIF